jgi:hypothetical protein
MAERKPLVKKPAERKPLIRKEPLIVPWAGVFVGYARQWVARNHWRVAAELGDTNDSLQECGLIFARCLRKYEYRVDNAAWFMALYKRALYGSWNTYARKATRYREICAAEPFDVVGWQNGPVCAAIAQCSIEAQHVMSMLAEAPQDMVTAIFAPCNPKVVDARLRKWFVLPNEVDFMTELHGLLGITEEAGVYRAGSASTALT